MRLSKLVAVALAFAGLAALLSGCLVFKTPVKGKQISQKKVQVKFKICESSAPGESGGCANLGNSGEGAESDESARPLLGFRVPKGTRLPPQIRSSQDFPIVLRRETSYKQELNAKAPKNANFKYFGYRGDLFAGGGDSRDREATFKVKMRLPKGYDRKNFKVRPVVGAQAVDTGGPVDCGPSVFDAQTGANAICIDSPAPGQMKNVRIKLDKD
jgi:hypothetical protein